MDSKADFSKYDEFISNEDRYRTLEKINPDMYKELLDKNRDNAISRYEYFSNLENDSQNN